MRPWFQGLVESQDLAVLGFSHGVLLGFVKGILVEPLRLGGWVVTVHLQGDLHGGDGSDPVGSLETAGLLVRSSAMVLT